jgi:hypothetical protein
LCAALSAAFFATSAHAAELLKEGKDWRNCSKDEQCVIIQGLCDKTAVNALVKEQAEAFYRQEGKNASCDTPFWRVGEKVARCRLGSCETIVKQGRAAAEKGVER